jgi:1-acyl-sn-glycerol-3-phosphate acyltransferase
MMKNSNKQQITSHIAPWLINIVYPLGSSLVIPFYFGKIDISGQENIPPSGAVIVAPTHRSRWDALLVPYATGRLVSGRDLYFMVL